MSIPAGGAFIDVKPSFRTFARDFTKGAAAGGKAGGAAAGREFGKAAASSAEPSLRKLGAAVGTARSKEADAAGKVRVAEARLAEVRDDSRKKASDQLRVEEQLAKAQRELKAAQDRTTDATDAYTRAQKRAASETADTDREVRRLDGRLGKVRRSFGKAGGAAKGFLKSGGGQFAAGAAAYVTTDAVVSLTKDAIGEAREAQKISATTEQVIKSTGGAANVSADQVGKLAESISNKTGVDDEQIQAGANLLLTFKQVRNEAGKGADVFDRATRAASDLSATGFGSIESSSKMLGKALNDPTKGISALSRAGVTFSKEQQAQIRALQHGGTKNAFAAMGVEGITDTALTGLAKKQFGGDVEKAIASLQKGWTKAEKAQFRYYEEGGHQLEAQKRILKEVEGQVGGVAEKNATAGEKLAVSWGNFKEQVGTQLLPQLDRLQGFLSGKAIPAASQFIEEMSTGKGTGGEFASTLRDIGGALKDGATFVTTYKKEILLVPGAFAGWKAISGTVRGVSGAVTRVRDDVSSLRTAASSTRKTVSSIADGLKGNEGAGRANRLGGAIRSLGGRAKDAAKWTGSAAKSAGSAAVQYGKLAGGYVKTGAAAAGAAVKTTALKGAQIAGTVASKAAAVGVRLFNAALAANPIGLVITGLILLGTGLVVAYKKSETFRRIVNGAWAGIKKGASAVVGWFREKALPWLCGVFQSIGDKAGWLWSKIGGKNGVFPKLKAGIRSVKDAFSSAKDGINIIWGKLVGVVSKPINAARNWIEDNFLSKVRSVLRAIGAEGLADKIPSLRAGGATKARVQTSSVTEGGYRGVRADGGVLPGYTPGRDVHWYSSPTGGLLGLSGGEAVMRPEFTRAVGKGWVDALNHAARAGGVAGVQRALTGQALASGGIVALGRRLQQMGYHVSEHPAFGGVAPGAHSANGWHYKAGALDVNADPWLTRFSSEAPALDRLNAMLRSEGWNTIWRAANHFDHLHVDVGNGQGKGGGLSGLFGGLAGKILDKGAKALTTLIGKIPVPGFWGQAAKAGFSMLIPAIVDKVKGAAAAMDTGEATGGYTSRAAGANVNLGRRMAAARGWTGNEWLALKELWTGESNWNHLARNPSSGAYGIPQSLPASKMASAGSDWRTNPATQIRWGMDYIAGRPDYGTPSRALAKWRSRSPHWYGKGGIMQIPAFASGTPSAPRGPAVVGEDGIELVWFNGGERVTSNRDTTRLLERTRQMPTTIRATFVDADGVLMGTIDGRVEEWDKATSKQDQVTARLGRG